MRYAAFSVAIGDSTWRGPLCDDALGGGSRGGLEGLRREVHDRDGGDDEVHGVDPEGEEHEAGARRPAQASGSFCVNMELFANFSNALPWPTPRLKRQFGVQF